MTERTTHFTANHEETLTADLDPEPITDFLCGYLLP